MRWLAAIVKLNIHNKGFNMAGFLTNSGLAKLAVATPLTPMTVKYMAFDAGQGAATPTMTALFNEVYRTEIPNPVKDTSTPKNLTFSGFVPTTAGGWTVYGVGLFDSLNVLVAYLQLAEPVTKSDPSSALKMSWQQDFIITLANAGETDLIITDSIEFRHDALTNRNAADSHPISAITGLSTALDNANTGVSDVNTSINLDRKYKKITADYTVLNTDGGVIEVDASAGNITITVAKSTSHISKKFLIIRTDDTANTVAVTPSSGDSLNGEGISYSSWGLSRYESILWVAGDNYWTGVRSIGASTTDKKGTVQLATPTETQVGTNATKAITPSAYSASTLGWGQSYTNVTASRVLGTVYTNSTGRPIQVIISTVTDTSAPATNITVGGVIIATASGSASYYQGVPISFVVPNGATYKVDGAISKWVELR